MNATRVFLLLAASVLAMPVQAAPMAPAAAVAPNAGQAPAFVTPHAAGTEPWPSFLVRGEVLCFDELDFNAFNKTGRFHTRGSNESCTRMTELTRVAVISQTGGKSEVRVVSGPLAAHVGWTNGRLPIAGPKPTAAPAHNPGH